MASEPNKETRVYLTDETWADLDMATVYQETSKPAPGGGTTSDATGQKYERQELIVTRKGRYILHNWTIRDRRQDYYEPIGPREADAWLKRMRYARTINVAAEEDAARES